MVSTGVPSLDNLLGSDGDPYKSAILVVGPPGIGKETLGYWFIRSGLIQGDYCLYVTHRPVTDVIRDMKGSGIGLERVPEVMTLSPVGRVEKEVGSTPGQCASPVLQPSRP